MTRRSLPSGVLVVNKPVGPTSRDVVNTVVRVLGTRRVGHAGTLDPFADGLLLVAYERATGLVPYLLEYEKTYRATVRFGRITDTQDRTGAVLAEIDPRGLAADAIRAALPSFRGRIAQVPPMYSAVKQEGRRLYELARRGQEVERRERERTVTRFELVEWANPIGRFEVVCSSGTYVRTLAHDLGSKVGTGASLQALTRTAVGPYRIEDALPADRIGEMERDSLLEASVTPADALPDWAEIRVADPEAVEVVHGSWRDPKGRAREQGRYRVIDSRGRLLALVRGGDPIRFLRVVAEAP